MVKYRKLNQDELEELKDDFIKFLASQSIASEDWEAWKTTDKEKVNELLDLFSDIVLEKVLADVKFLEMLSSNEIKIFSMHKEDARMVGIRINSDEIDLRKEEDLNTYFSSNQKVKRYNSEVFQLEKKYTKVKTEEVFFLLENGAAITNETLFSSIDALLKKG